MHKPTKQNFFDTMKKMNLEVKGVNARFPFQDPKQNVEAFEVEHLDANVRLYVCFNSDGQLLTKKVEVL